MCSSWKFDKCHQYDKKQEKIDVGKPWVDALTKHSGNEDKMSLS